MQNYTIAYMQRRNSGASRVILAVVPDGDAIIDRARHAAVMNGIVEGDKIFVEYSLNLTNDKPFDRTRVLWKEGVSDPDGNQFQYACRTLSGISAKIIRLDR